MTSSPLWPGAPGSGEPGIAEYGIRLADCPASATAPSPEPKTIATRGRRLPSRSATASAARRISSEPAAPIPQSAFRIPQSQQDPRERRRQEVRQRPRDHGPEPESGENCMRLNERSSTLAIVRISNVLASPGTPVTSAWPPTNSDTSAYAHTSSCAKRVFSNHLLCVYGH